jgi:hypothetical protein
MPLEHTSLLHIFFHNLLLFCYCLKHKTMGLAQGYTWYAKYIAEAAYQNLPSTNSTPDIIRLPLEINRSAQGGFVLIVESSIATVILALVTLTASTVIPIIFTRISKALAVLWCALHIGPPKKKTIEASRDPTPNATFHLPVILANAGIWTTDAWASINLSWQCVKYRELAASLIYIGVVILCLLGISTGPLVRAPLRTLLQLYFFRKIKMTIF